MEPTTHIISSIPAASEIERLMMDTNPKITTIGYNITVKRIQHVPLGTVTDPADELCPNEP
jgi:hypothetical protein